MGSKENFISKIYCNGKTYRVDDAEVYITKDGIVYMTCSPDWVDYFRGGTDDIPDNTKKVEVEDLL